jgi:hypothetical protein
MGQADEGSASFYSVLRTTVLSAYGIKIGNVSNVSNVPAKSVRLDTCTVHSRHLSMVPENGLNMLGGIVQL